MNNDEEKIDIQPVPSLDEVDEVVNNLPTMPIIHTDTEVEEEVKKDESVFELPEMPSSPIEIAPVPKLEFEEEEVGSPKFNIPESQLNNVVEEEKTEEKKEFIEIEEEPEKEEEIQEKIEIKRKRINPKIFIVLGSILFVAMVLLLLKVFVFKDEENDDIQNDEYFNSLKNTGYYNNYKDFAKDWVGTYSNSENNISFSIYLTSDESYSIEFIDNSKKNISNNKAGVESFGGGFGGKSGTLVDSLYKIIFKKNKNTIEVKVTEQTDDEIISRVNGTYEKINISDKNYNGVYSNEDNYVSIYVYDEDGECMFYYKKDRQVIARFCKLVDDKIKVDSCSFAKKGNNYLFSCEKENDEDYVKMINNMSFTKK